MSQYVVESWNLWDVFTFWQWSSYAQLQPHLRPPRSSRAWWFEAKDERGMPHHAYLGVYGCFHHAATMVTSRIKHDIIWHLKMDGQWMVDGMAGWVELQEIIPNPQPWRVHQGAIDTDIRLLEGLDGCQAQWKTGLNTGGFGLVGSFKPLSTID